MTLTERSKKHPVTKTGIEGCDAGPVVSEVSESYKIVSPKELRTFIDEWITNKDQNP